jgi:serine/threonine protein kinase
VTADDNTPVIVGEYRLEKCIGQGTYGKVRLGFHTKTGEKVAVKIIDKASAKSPRHVARVHREIRFLSLLHHPHIVRIYDVVETANAVHLMMEWAAGGELFDYIVKHKRLKEQEARHFFRQIVSAVDYCHKNSVIHRDLKPENLLLDENNNIKIIDFGFSNTFRSDALLDTFCGSPYYAAPEMILGKRYCGPEVDIWSMGVILFALLCGYLPFDQKDVKELYKHIAHGTYDIPSKMPAGARHLIQRMICVDPRRRATLEEVRNDPWLNQGFPELPRSLLPERPSLDVRRLNREALRRLSTFGYGPEETRLAFEDPRPNPIKNTYYLLCEMFQREHERQLRERRANQAHPPPLSNAGSQPALLSRNADPVAEQAAVSNLMAAHMTFHSTPNAQQQSSNSLYGTAQAPILLAAQQAAMGAVDSAMSVRSAVKTAEELAAGLEERLQITTGGAAAAK